MRIPTESNELMAYPTKQKDEIGIEETHLQAQLSYWKQQLAGAPPVLELPTDRPRPPVQTFRSARRSQELPQTLTESLLVLSQKEGVTLFMTLLTAFKTLLYRYTGLEDILVGSPITNPNSNKTEDMGSFKANTLVLRTLLQGNPSFSELLGLVREIVWEAYAHQDLPFEKLVEELQPERSLSYSPLFQVMFALQNTQLEKLELARRTCTPLQQESLTFKFDLALSMEETDRGLLGLWKYNTDLFDASTIYQMAGHFQTLLEGIVAHPELPISELPLLSEAERHQQLVKWNDTQTEYPQDKCIHQLFEEQVERTPDAVALVYQNEQLTYRQLNTRANQLAHHLQGLGVGPEVLVGICVERSLEMVVGLLGILKAGGAYVPLDPTYPQERLNFMLSDSLLSVLLTQEKLVNRLTEHQAYTICLDTHLEVISQESDKNPISEVKPDNLAYVIYTSGSTGKPKGVLVPHQAVNRLVLNTNYINLQSQDVVAFASNFSFDAATFEIWGTLLHGAKLVSVSKDVVLSPRDFADFIHWQEISVLFLTTALFNQIASVVPSAFRSVQHLLFGGEAVEPRWVKEVLKNGPPQRLLHVYGPTESTTFTTWCLIQDVPEGAKTIPIGRPISNTCCFVLDDQKQPVPVGVPGELYIGGAGLAHGYLNRPELTQEKFIPNPFSQQQGVTRKLSKVVQPSNRSSMGLTDNSTHGAGADAKIMGQASTPTIHDAPQTIQYTPAPLFSGNILGTTLDHFSLGASLYKTGDLARYLPNGNIEFLGRIDHQVKIRGFRVELLEIEAILSQHPRLKQVLVIDREDVPGDKRLVAYIVHDQEQVPKVSELRCLLKEKLPDYMVPSTFVMLEAMPLTPNGKVNRKALPAPDTIRPDLEENFVSPRTPVEEVLTEIWTEVLRVEQVGVDDNFFELGGHSLLATQVISRIPTTLAVELPLRSLFEHPTVARLAEKIENLLRLGQSLQAPPLLPIARSAEMPLSFAQQRLWFFYQLEPDSAFYNIPDAVRLFGQLNITALEQSFNEIIRRHEALRTNFITVQGQPVTVIASTQKLALPIVDLQDLQDSERLIKTQRLATTEAQRPFDLATEPLVRVTLLKLQAQEHVLLLTMHHIVSDGWSMDVLFRELAALYEAFCAGAPSPLPELPIQYADFAHWQRQWLSGEVLETQLTYWQQQLTGVTPLLELPTDRPRPPRQTFRGGIESFELNADLTQKLQTLSQQSGATLFMTLLAAFVTLLSRYSSHEDIVVGSPIANRHRREIEPLIGFFVNTLVLRTHLEGNPSFWELLQRVRQVALDAYAYQELPFEQVVEALQPERNLSHSPLFQVMFVLQNTPMGKLELPGLTITPLKLESVTAKFDLTLSMEETESGLIGSWEYNSDLFDAATITRMAGHFQSLLEAIVANPQQRLLEFPLLMAAERHQLLVEWNNTQRDYPQDTCIHKLFEAQVQRTPDAVAVVFENEQLTYRQLNLRANQLAHYLQALGVGPDVLVGIYVERSLEMVVGLLGILKAGGAYVPLDPAYPQKRLAFMLEDAFVQVLLTQQRLVSELQSHEAKMVCLDTDWDAIACQCESNPVSGVSADNLAYVIYTSGSTGKPKGVAIEHHSTVALLDWARATFAPEDLAGVLASTSICFDLSVFELFVPLSWGGKVILAENALHLPTLPAAADLRLINTVPSAIVELLRVDGVPNSVRTVNLAGEPLQNRLVQQLYQQDTIQQVFNLYGPSEDTTYSTFALVKRGASESPTIGRPIANTQIYILDSNLQPVPVGVPGELYIGGDSLARGYLNRPELTAERFIPHPFSNLPGTRLYKTGDLARYLPDAKIEFLGRIDQQVKVRGFRIELGEIEAVLSQHPAVRQNVVILREDVPGDQRLVAYFVPQLQAATVNDLRQFLREKLPEYMMPSAFVLLESLPLTPNGKVDRRALPSPDPTRCELEETFVAARTPVEEVLTGIWTEVLRVEQVGVDDNFFELGGHSLLAIQVISRIPTTLAVELPLRSLFEHPTVARLAEKIENLLRLGQSLQAPPLLPIARSAEMPLSFAQQRLWFFYQLEPDSAFYNIPDAVRLFGQLNITALEQSFNEIIRRHEALRTNFITVEGQPVTVIASTQKLALPIVDLQDLQDSERLIETQRLATTEAQRPFDLATEPLVRATLLKLQAQEHVLLLTMHHIVSDGWSLGVLFHELAALYEAFCSGHPSPLAELPIQYIDFAVWQRQWLQAEVVESQRSYWKQQLDGAPALLELPADRPRPVVQTFRGAHHSIALSQQLSLALTNLSRGSGVTLFMTLLAAFQTLLYRYTQQEDIVVGSPIANRNHSSCEGLIGFFVNSLVLRTNLGGNPTFQELLNRVREVTLAAYAHQDLPFEQLVEGLQPARSLSYTPLFQVVFALQNAAVMPSVELSGLSVTPLTVETGTAKFDLTVSMENTAQGLKGVFEYNTDLFDAATIARLAGHFQTLLEGIVAHPHQQLSDLLMLSATEQHQILVEWNDAKADYPQDVCIHELFEAQVKQAPDALALVFGDRQLTYRELNIRSNQLAHYLQKLGIGAEVLVGLCVERSLELVIGMLGILKAGAAYLPLDPSYPTERLSFILEEAQVPVLLTQQRWMECIGRQKSQVICLDQDWETIVCESEDNPKRNVTADNLAYVIYTSGSTGIPKGVEIEHQGLLNLVFWHQQAFAVSPLDRVTQVAKVAFDACGWEIWPYLSAGASIYFPNDETKFSPQQMRDWLVSKAITVSFQPTPLAEQLLSLDWPNNAALRILLTGGDKLQQYPLASHPFLVINNYGPTENTVVTTSGHVPVKNQAAVAPAIGRPIANTQIYLLDDHLQPVSIGVPGELYVSGDGLARSYFNRPDLTAEKFIPNPFSNQLGTRLYKTGDLGRYLPDGNIEFLGRIDHQVKIRGFRIELGEIEAALVQHEKVRQAVVIAWDKQPGDKRLVAYVTLKQKPGATVSELRCFLKEILPEYMVPSAFVMLDALPLTPNGKVDRKALPFPDRTHLEREGTFVAPRTPLEEVVAGIWVEVLELEKVGIHDNFFELGGHSLLATQLISRVCKAFCVELPLHSLFETPTVAGMCQAINVMGKADTFDTIDAYAVTDLNAEAVLDPSICPKTLPVKYVTEPNCILLTGATGFLGAFLLHELLEQTQADIYCLVRSSNAKEAKKKMENSLKYYWLWNGYFSSRIIPIVGDLSQPLLGFSFEQFQMMASKIDIIYHNGAVVNSIYPYSALKATNVLGTQEVLRLATQIKLKPVHLISTLSVFSSNSYSQERVILEQDNLERSEGIDFGYAQSKWVAEKLVMIARSRGLPVCVYRPGRISGHSQTGACQTDDFLWRLIKGCIQFGSVPDLDIMVDLAPVDYVSKAIVHLSRQPESLTKAFHLVNPHSIHFSKLIEWMKSFGYQLEQISYEKWRAELINFANRSSENALYPLVPLFYGTISEQQTPDQTKKPQFDYQNTLNGLAGTSIICSPVNAELLSTYFSYFIRSGYLSAPSPMTELGSDCLTEVVKSQSE